MKEKRNESLQTVFVSLWLGFVAFVLIMGMTGPHGIGTTADSIQYFQAAKFAATGEGFLVFSAGGALEPLTQFPPLYPAALLLGNYFGVDVFNWARILAAFLFGLNVFLIAMLVFRMTGQRRSAVMAGGLALISVHMVETHAIALSESLFLALMFGFFWALMRFIEDQRPVDLAAAALLAGLAMTTRYGGLSVIVTGAIVLWFRTREGRERKLRDVSLYLVLALFLPALWFLRNMRLAHRPIGYDFGFFPQGFFHIIDGINTLSLFLLPSIVPIAVRWIVLVLFLAALVRLVQKFFGHMREESCVARLQIGWIVVGTFILVYGLGALVTVVTAAKGEMPLDRWILLPLLAGSIILVPTLIRQSQLENASRRMIGFSAFFLLLFLAFSFLRTVKLARDVYHKGYGYNATAWVDTALVRNVKTLSDEVPAYASDPYAFYFYTGRPAILIPPTGSAAPFFPPEDQVRKQFLEDRAVAVIFEQARFKPRADWLALAASIPLTTFLNDNWGSIWGYKKEQHP